MVALERNVSKIVDFQRPTDANVVPFEDPIYTRMKANTVLIPEYNRVPLEDPILDDFKARTVVIPPHLRVPFESVPDPSDPEDGIPTQVNYEVIAGAVAGDPDALAEVYDMYQARILAYCSWRLPYDEVEDAASNVWVNALRRFGRYQDLGGPVSPWLYQIARNEVTDIYRRNARHHTVELTEEVSMHDSDDLANVEAAMMRDTTARVVEVLVSHLPKETQKIMWRRHIRGLSIKNTARETGKTEGNVKALDDKGKKTMRRNLNQIGITLGDLLEA